MIEQIFQRVLILSLSGAVLTVILLLLRKLTSILFGSKWHYYTYVAAILVFLIPLSIKLPQKEAVNTYTRVQEAQVFFVPSEADDSTPENVEITMRQVSKTSIKDKLFGIYLQISDYFPYVWLLGFCIYFSFSVLSHIMFTRKMKQGAVYLDSISDLGKRSLKVAKSSAVSSPVLVGVISPTLFLPERDITDEDFHNILSHETVHLKRHDIEIKWLCLFARAIHWFNPFVHMLASAISKECEISCDLEATSSMDKRGITSYCETILSLVTVKDENAVMPTLGVGSSKKTLERRFRAIMQEKKKGKKIVIISVIVACVVILGAFTASALLAGSTESGKNTSENQVIDVTDKEPERQGEYIGENVPKNASEEEIAEFETVEEEPIVKYVVVENNTEYKLIPLEESDEATIQVFPITDAEISAPFDDEKHPAVDYKLEAGTAVTSPIEGTIKTAEYDVENGNHIEIAGLDGTTKVLFANLEKMYVNAGDKVNTGDIVGTVGTTGMSTGPHLHVEYSENGQALNPVNVIFVEQDGKISAMFSEPVLAETEEK